MAVPQEFYIRNASETDARGPFNLEQVMSLAEAGQVTLETLYYDSGTEQWVAVGGSDEVKSAVFPEKKKLTVNRDPKFKTLNQETDSAAPISVNDMLAAAEGRTADTKDKSDPAIAMARAAKIGMFSAIAALFLAAVGEVLPNVDALMTGDPMRILAEPLIIFGLVDVGMALLLLLGVAAIYPFVRFRAALGAGFLFVWYSMGAQPDSTALLCVALGSAGLYLCTVFVGYLTVSIAAAMAVAGMAGFAWFALMG